MTTRPIAPRYVCNCKVCGRRYWSREISLKPDLCIACWIEQMEKPHV